MTKWNNGNYLLLKGWAKEYCTPSDFKILQEQSVYIRNVVNDGGRLSSLMISPQTPVMKFLEEQKNTVIKAVEKKFRLKNLDMRVAGNLMKFRDGIKLHNDWFKLNETFHPDAIVARGILTVNPTYVFGTDVYTKDGMKETHVDELGGYPGDLFIFKCSPTSWHSVGFKKDRHVPRYTINIVFRHKKHD
jgi:hypothetical protein